MNPRQKRIQRVVEVREKSLKNEVTELGRMQASERAAEAAEERARQQTINAEQRQRELSQKGANVGSFLEAVEWLRKTSYDAELALHRLAQARVARERAQLKVKAARTQVKQVEKVAERLGEHERLAGLAAERKMEDELAGRGFFFDKQGG